MMDKPDLDRLEALLEKATATPWRYRPDQYDDWGWIRGPDRFPVAVARAGCHTSLEEEAAHRAAGTDPYGPNALLVVEAVNALPALIAALRAYEGERERVREVIGETMPPCELGCHPICQTAAEPFYPGLCCKARAVYAALGGEDGK